MKSKKSEMRDSETVKWDAFFLKEPMLYCCCVQSNMYSSIYYTLEETKL